MASEADSGKKALDARDYPLAIKHLTNALKQSQSPVWLSYRSTAYQRKGEFELALADADNAVIAAVKRARREQIATAQFRRAIALHGLKRFGDARMCLNWCSKINDKEKGLTLWIGLVKKDYDDAGGADGEGNEVTVKEIPDPVEEVTAVAVAHEEEKKGGKLDKGKGKEVVGAGRTQQAASSVVPTPKEKIRHEWYQSSTGITVDVLASGVEKGKVDVTFEERSLEVSFPVDGSSNTFDFTLSPLYGDIVPGNSTYRVTPRKIEITLFKKQAGFKWAALEWKAGLNPLEPTAPTATSSNTDVPAVPLSILNPPGTIASEPKTGPAYPTSSRTGPKNWDKIGADDDDEEDSSPDAFFKKLYKNADDNTKKAMMKSMQESGGTSLSTVWDDVSSKTFDPVPPEGMEAKKY